MRPPRFLREARTADVFVALRPNSVPDEPERAVENILFGSGRHVYLVPPRNERKTSFERVLVAWNGSREAARALGECLPYLKGAESVVVCVVDIEPPVEDQALLGTDVKHHLKHHGIAATYFDRWQNRPQVGHFSKSAESQMRS